MRVRIPPPGESLREMDPELLRLEKSVDAMGATFSVVLYGRDWPRMESAVDAAFQEVCRLERMLSIHRPDSECSEVNRQAARRAVRVSYELARLLSFCLDFSRRSEGAFDISIAPLIRTWNFHWGRGRLPGDEEVRAALAIVGHQRVHLDLSTRTVRFECEGVEIDLGGIGKGYAVDRMADILKQRGFDTALIAGSGSSICGLGAPPGDQCGWTTRIRDPRLPRKIAGTVPLKDMSISTSGTYEKSFWAGGKTYSHILDPRTGYPVQGALSVSVVAPRALDGEAWAKPCIMLGREWAIRHVPETFGIYYFDERPDAASL